MAAGAQPQPRDLSPAPPRAPRAFQRQNNSPHSPEPQRHFALEARDDAVDLLAPPSDSVGSPGNSDQQDELASISIPPKTTLLQLPSLRRSSSSSDKNASRVAAAAAAAAAAATASAGPWLAATLAAAAGHGEEEETSIMDAGYSLADGAYGEHSVHGAKPGHRQRSGLPSLASPSSDRSSAEDEWPHTVPAFKEEGEEDSLPCDETGQGPSSEAIGWQYQGAASPRVQDSWAMSPRSSLCSPCRSGGSDGGATASGSAGTMDSEGDFGTEGASPKSGGVRPRFTPEQCEALERSFQENRNLDACRRQKLAAMLGVQPRQVAIWFQNRRARLRYKLAGQQVQSMSSKYQDMSERCQRIEQRYECLKQDHKRVLEQNASLRCQISELTAALSKLAEGHADAGPRRSTKRTRSGIPSAAAAAAATAAAAAAAAADAATSAGEAAASGTGPDATFSGDALAPATGSSSLAKKGGPPAHQKRGGNDSSAPAQALSMRTDAEDTDAPNTPARGPPSRLQLPLLASTKSEESGNAGRGLALRAGAPSPDGSALQWPSPGGSCSSSSSQEAGSKDGMKKPRRCGSRGTSLPAGQQGGEAAVEQAQPSSPGTPLTLYCGSPHAAKSTAVSTGRRAPGSPRTPCSGVPKPAGLGSGSAKGTKRKLLVSPAPRPSGPARPIAGAAGSDPADPPRAAQCLFGTPLNSLAGAMEANPLPTLGPINTEPSETPAMADHSAPQGGDAKGTPFAITLEDAASVFTSAASTLLGSTAADAAAAPLLPLLDAELRLDEILREWAGEMEAAMPADGDPAACAAEGHSSARPESLLAQASGTALDAEALLDGEDGGLVLQPVWWDL